MGHDAAIYLAGSLIFACGISAALYVFCRLSEVDKIRSPRR